MVPSRGVEKSASFVLVGTFLLTCRGKNDPEWPGDGRPDCYNEVTMKAIKCDLPREMKSAEIIPLADFHLGDSMSDWKHIDGLLKHIEETPNCYAVLGGDILDTAIASSIGDTYAANLNPMSQIEMAVKLFDPIKEKILAVCGGNHERRVYKTDGLDMTQIYCNQLGIGDRYTSTTALLFIRIGRDARHGQDKSHGRQTCYTMYLTHGGGGGRKEGGKINRLADLETIVDADIYVTAHTHLPATFKTGYFRTSTMNSSVAYVEKLFVNTASALNYGGYGDVQGYKPGSKSYPRIVISGEKKEAKVIL